MKTAFCNFAAPKAFMKVYLKHIITLAFATFIFSACGKKEKELTPGQLKEKADSIVMTRMEKLRRQAKEDLDRRLPIELKPKMDSIRKVNHDLQPVPVFPDDNIGLDDTDSGPGISDTVPK